MREASVIEAIRQTRDYLRNNGYHATVTSRHYLKARRFLGIDLHPRWGWIMRPKWIDRLREIGLDPESLEIIDRFRWAVAWEMANDPANERSFNIDEFRRRLAQARLVNEKPRAVEDSGISERERLLSGFGIELD